MPAQILGVILCGVLSIGGATAAETGTVGPLVRDVRAGYPNDTTGSPPNSRARNSAVARS